MKRYIEQSLVAWKSSRRRKPLILRGVRQVGKTWSVRAFGQRCFDSFALVDLERNPNWHRVFEGDLDPRRICRDLEILLNQKITPGKTLLFIDEIQSCPSAITALRYFHEEFPEQHVIAAGSLIDFVLKDISFPVGRIQFLELRPMSFSEFLRACGHDEASEIILERPGKVSEAIHGFLLEELKRYFFVGGMPESVKAYVESGSIRESFDVQGEIVETYRMDFGSYRPSTDRYCLNTVLTSVSQHLGQQIKYARLGEGYSNPTLKKSFDLLCMANVIQKIPSANPLGLPLGATADARTFKALVADIGLMRYLTGMPPDVEYQKTELLDMYRGALAEQFVGQEMSLSQNGELYYWSRRAKSSTAEIDFLFVENGQIFPVEVKSGTSGSLKSLHFFLKKYPDCEKAIILSSRPYAELPEQKLIFVPIYFAFSATGGAVGNF